MRATGMTLLTKTVWVVYGGFVWEIPAGTSLRTFPAESPQIPSAVVLQERPGAVPTEAGGSTGNECL